MKVVAILQARIGSTRLPGKVLLPLAGAPLVQRMYERVKRAKKIDQVVLAVPSKDINAFMPFAKDVCLYGYPLDENDLVGRYLSAAEAYDADIIVRIPCDNPCVEPEYIDQAIQDYRWGNVPFYSNTTAMCDGIYVDGIGAEVFSISRLKLLDDLMWDQPRHREHPHLYLNYPLPVASLRLDVNTQADYEFIKDIYDALYPVNPEFSIHDILAYLDAKKVTV